MFRQFLLSGLLLGAACLAPTLALAQEGPKSDADTIKKLIADLGADEFSTRETATEQLSRIGLPAYKAVEAVVQHPDREVRYRAERVLGRIRQNDLQRRVEAFLAGREADDDYQLPGWKRFKNAFGDADSSRKIFVDLLKSDQELLQALEANPKTVTELIGQRITQNQQLMQFGGAGNFQLTFGQVAILVFIAGEDDVALNNNHQTMIFNYCNQTGFSEAVLSTTTRGEVPKKMVARAILRSEDFATYQAMSLARRFQMKEGLVCAEKILKANRAPHLASQALTTIASMGDETHLPLVEKLFTDTNLVTQMQERDKVMLKVEVRDSALAAAVFLTKQDLKNYYSIPAGQTVTDPQTVLTNARIIGHSEDAKRAEVFRKWAEYREKNPPKATDKKPEGKPEAEPTKAEPAKPAEAPAK